MKNIIKILAVLMASLLVMCSCGGASSSKEAKTFAEKLEQIDLDNFSVTGSVNVEFSDMLFKAVGADNSSLAMVKELGIEAVGGNFTFIRHKDMFSVSGNALMNNKNIIKGSCVVDADNGQLYLSVPDLNKKPLKVDMYELGLGDINDAIAMLDSLNASKEIEFDFDLYCELYEDTMKYALETLPKPSKTNTKISVAGLTQSVQAVTYTITPDDVVKSTSMVMDKLVHDKRFKTLVSQAFPIVMSALEDYVPELAMFSHLSGDDIGMIFDSYVLPEFENMMEELAEDAGVEGEPVIVTYYLANDEFAGCEIKADDSVVSLLIVRNSGKVKAQATVDGYVLASFDGKESKNVITGILSADNGFSIGIEDFDISAAKKGIIRGALLLDSNILGSDFPEDMTLKLRSDMDFLTSNRFAVELYQNKSQLIKCVLGLDIEPGSGKINVPKNAVSDPESWAMDCVDGLDGVVDNLKKAGLSKTYVSQLKSAVSMIKAQSSKASAPANNFLFG